MIYVFKFFFLLDFFKKYYSLIESSDDIELRFHDKDVLIHVKYLKLEDLN